MTEYLAQHKLEMDRPKWTMWMSRGRINNTYKMDMAIEPILLMLLLSF